MLALPLVSLGREVLGLGDGIMQSRGPHNAGVSWSQKRWVRGSECSPEVSREVIFLWISLKWTCVGVGAEGKVDLQSLFMDFCFQLQMIWDLMSVNLQNLADLGY